MGIDIPVPLGYWRGVFNSTQQDEVAALAARIAELEAENRLLQKRHLEVTTQLEASRQTVERLRSAYTSALEPLQLRKRRLFVAKAERREAVPEQLQLDLLVKQVAQLGKELAAAEAASPSSSSETGADPKEQPKAKSRRVPETKPAGRRNLEKSDLPPICVEIPDPELEGTAERIGVETSWKLGWERGGQRRICVKRVVYQLPSNTGKTPLRSSRQSSPRSYVVAPCSRQR